MSIYDDAGVIQIPSAYKKSVSNGTLYSVVPSNGDGDFTFTRGSNATRVNKDGLIEEVSSHIARLDYPLIDGEVQDCPALLLEPSRTNNLQRSEEFDNGYWTKTNSTITANQIVSPDGSQNADTLTQSSAGGYLRKDVSFSGSETASFFVKANSVNFVALFSGGNEVYFDLINGYATSSSGSTLVSYKIDSYGNGWYRCSITTNYSGSSSIRLYPSQSDGAKDTTTGSVYIWGAQFEAGSYQTSYIPTSGSTVTRSADVCNGSGTSAEFNDSEGVLFAEIQALVDDGSLRLIQINDGSTVNNMVTLGYNSAFGQLLVQIRSGGGTTNVFTHNITDVTLYNKLGLKYEQNTATLYVNGFEAFSSSITATPIGLSELDFDYNGGFPVYARTKQLMTFKTALTDSELETLTSWDSFNAMAKGQLYTVY
jgi:hypothetical protein